MFFTGLWKQSITTLLVRIPASENNLLEYMKMTVQFLQSWQDVGILTF